MAVVYVDIKGFVAICLSLLFSLDTFAVLEGVRGWVVSMKKLLWRHLRKVPTLIRAHLRSLYTTCLRHIPRCCHTTRRNLKACPVCLPSCASHMFHCVHLCSSHVYMAGSAKPLIILPVQSQGVPTSGAFPLGRTNPTSPAAMPQGEELKHILLQQLEYYFSKDNLSSDKYLCECSLPSA